MADYVVIDRVKETTATTGTGTLTLAGAVAGYQAFSAVGNGNKCFYCIEAVNSLGVPTGDWEVGKGTYTSAGTTLSRDTVLFSSNANAAVNLAAGTKNVFLDVAATMLNSFGASGATTHFPGGVPDPGAVAGTTKILREDATWQTIATILGSQTANRVYAGPSSGGASPPDFRALVAADMPLFDSFGLLNASGATTAVGTVGYVDASGKFKTTTTANLDGVAWAVAVSIATNVTAMLASRCGKVTVLLDANCSVGDFLTTSATAGQATPSANFRAEVFAIALTPNAGGAGGTCLALLLCNTRYVSATNADFLFSVTSHDNTAFTATISGTPSTTSVVYTPVGGNENNLVPTSGSSNWGKMRIWNTTRGTYRLIDNTDTATNTITTIASTDAWANGDSLTIESQTTLSGVTSKFVEIDLTQATALSIIPATARSLRFEQNAQDTTAAVNKYDSVHPFSTYASSKQSGVRTQVNSATFTGHTSVPLISRVFCFQSSTGGAAARFSSIALEGYFLAEP